MILVKLDPFLIVESFHSRLFALVLDSDALFRNDQRDFQFPEVSMLNIVQQLAKAPWDWGSARKTCVALTAFESLNLGCFPNGLAITLLCNLYKTCGLVCVGPSRSQESSVRVQPKAERVSVVGDDPYDPQIGRPLDHGPFFTGIRLQSRSCSLDDAFREVPEISMLAVVV